jgi:hypothetical protein
MATAMKRARARVTRKMVMTTRVSDEGRRWRQRGQWQQQQGWRATKRALAMDFAIATATMVVGNKKGNGKGG